jgi:carbamoyl-phosphate synthase large subunit
MLFFKKRLVNSFVQEFIKGKEYTIDGVNDLKGKFIAASPRIRLETKGGLAVKSIVVNDPKMVNFAKIIAEGLGIIGPFNVQCISDGREAKYIEINNRFPSGGLPLTVKSGLNIPLIIVKILLGKKVKVPKIKAGLIMTRYWDAIILNKINKKYKIL